MQKKIIEKYPSFFVRHSWTPDQTSMCWGIQIGDGWLFLIDDLCRDLQKLVNDGVVEKFEFECIKEKFGSLRIQYRATGNHKEINRLIYFITNKASITCERCSNHIFRTNDSSNSGSDSFDVLCNKCR
jgi:hypothetical protein